ncbi:unnamed protein product [Mytilus coruscus]|uniref:Uncharacterized protein n=1 Tax=Mytilus coruscus TaxID=42192 RepID=A0A6J8B9Z0_MYTCO|nr:unnamed protein product [Mytilus coruscus]
MSLNSDKYSKIDNYRNILLVSPSYNKSCIDCSKPGGYSSQWTLHALSNVTEELCLGTGTKDIAPINWKNNSCESMNNILKLSTNWKAVKLPDLIDKLQKLFNYNIEIYAEHYMARGIMRWLLGLKTSSNRSALALHKDEKHKLHIFESKALAHAGNRNDTSNMMADGKYGNNIS